MQGVRRGVRFLRIPSAREWGLENHVPCVQRGALTQSSGAIVRSSCDVLEFFLFHSSMSARLCANGLELHENGFRSQFMGMCTETPLQGEARFRKAGPTGDPRKLYEDMVASLAKKVIPYPNQLQELIRSASTASEVALAMDAAVRVRQEMMLETGKMEVRHTKEVTHMMVAAFLRAGDKQSALKLLWRKNPDGFTTSIGTAHLLLKHAKLHKSVKFMRHVVRVMAANDVRLTQTAADIILRLCKESGEIDLMFSLAKDYHKAGLTFQDSLFDVLISNAANAGDPKVVHEIQTWRDKQGLKHTTASAVSVAKALVLERKPKEAALMINDHCPADDASKTEKRERYLSIMVKVWPLQLVSSLNVESKEEYLQKLKKDVACMIESLRDFGLTLRTFDVSENFAQGKGSDSAAQKEVKVVQSGLEIV